MDLGKDRHVVLMLAAGGLLALVVILVAIRPISATGPWYVAPGGDDDNDCLNPATPCATIDGALAKADSGDTIYVATGTYAPVFQVAKDITISGGWDQTFSTQSGSSIIDGGGDRGIDVGSGTAILERFTVQNGANDYGSGIHVWHGATLILNNCTVTQNTACLPCDGGGISNSGNAILNNSTVSGNTARKGGGILNFGALTLNNSTVSRNTALVEGGGIFNDDGALTLNNSTVSGNTAVFGGGIYQWSGTVTLQNTILAGNTAGIGQDCSGTIASSGYNLIGDTTDCTFTQTTGDLIDVDAQLATFEGSPGYYPLKFTSPAIDGGNPVGCTDHLGDPLTTDQRGSPRPLDGDGDDEAICDIGSYEFDPDENPLFAIYLPIILRNH